MEKARGYITGKIREGAEHVAATQGHRVTCDLNLAGRPLILEVGTESLVLCFCVLMYQSVGKGKEWGAVFTTNSGYPSNKPARLLTALDPKHSVKIPLSALPSLRHLLNLFLVQSIPKVFRFLSGFAGGKQQRAGKLSALMFSQPETQLNS